MNDQTFRLTWCRLNGYEFRLAWNGFAMGRWEAAEIDADALYHDDAALAKALVILGKAASAVLCHCNYPADKVPSELELEEHFKCLAAPWERERAVIAIAKAIACGNDRQYVSAEADEDIDTVELKKN